MASKEKKKLRKERRRIEKKKAQGQKIDGHHIIPSSRGGKTSNKNMVYIDMYRHRDYHRLFDNKTPEEIIHYLLDYFWRGQTSHIIEALYTRGKYV